jgi:hypothetical protein
MRLDDICFPGMTVREMLHRAFKDDWNSRRTLLQLGKGGVFNTSLYLSLNDIPPELALEALSEVLAEEAKQAASQEKKS